MSGLNALERRGLQSAGYSAAVIAHLDGLAERMPDIALLRGRARTRRFARPAIAALTIVSLGLIAAGFTGALEGAQVPGALVLFILWPFQQFFQMPNTEPNNAPGIIKLAIEAGAIEPDDRSSTIFADLARHAQSLQPLPDSKTLAIQAEEYRDSCWGGVTLASAGAVLIALMACAYIVAGLQA
jgi:hypothetical protein